MKAHLKNILVPVDFNEPSLQAIDYAADIAKKIEGKLYLLYVIETKGIISDMLQSGNELVKITENIKDKLNNIAGKYSDVHNVEIETRVERGKIYKKVLDVGEQIDARFIVLGENHPYSGEDQTLGTTVYQVTIRSKEPVITVKGDKKELGKKFVVPLDLTKSTKKQMLAAIAYGINYGAEINLVSVKIANIRMRSSLIQKKLKRAVKTLEENNVASNYKLYEYSSKISPYKRVIEHAQDIDADMILLLTHQEGYTYDNYIGAFAHHIINESPVPVLSLTASAAAFKMEDFLKPILDPVGYLFKNEKK
jgi:nucleotide-binding universal stress UspA family protein